MSSYRLFALVMVDSPSMSFLLFPKVDAMQITSFTIQYVHGHISLWHMKRYTVRLCWGSSDFAPSLSSLSLIKALGDETTAQSHKATISHHRWFKELSCTQVIILCTFNLNIYIHIYIGWFIILYVSPQHFEASPCLFLSCSEGVTSLL